MHHTSNRQIKTPGPRSHDVVEHCRRNGIDRAEERKLVKLLGKFAPLHEIQANSPLKQPKFR
ncbi:MAG: hypothetical protein QHC90_04085 [Shinella sp.]|nr:hypothetical protein [Shinella sp.]